MRIEEGSPVDLAISRAQKSLLGEGITAKGFTKEVVRQVASTFRQLYEDTDPMDGAEAIHPNTLFILKLGLGIFLPGHPEIEDINNKISHPPEPNYVNGFFARAHVSLEKTGWEMDSPITQAILTQALSIAGQLYYYHDAFPETEKLPRNIAYSLRLGLGIPIKDEPPQQD